MKQHRAIFQQNSWRDFKNKRNVKPLSNRKEKESINPEFDRVLFDWIN
ncbi:MAG: hypothetical protein V4585_20900 [Bacteroidota bacterium]|jgi:hypothetical protein